MGPSKPVRPAKVGAAIALICPWVINVSYLNFAGSLDLAAKGLQGCFEGWIANRVYYFTYGLPNSSEHPTRRRRGIAAVYKLFYDTFVEDIAARRSISQERAEAFWLCVSDKVAFRSPELAEEQANTETRSEEGLRHE